jgi:hypothetical protein
VSEYVPAGQATHDDATNVVPTGQYAPVDVVYVTVLPVTTLVVAVVARTLIPLGKLIKTLEGGLADEHGDVVTCVTLSVRDTVPLVVSVYDNTPAVAA